MCRFEDEATYRCQVILVNFTARNYSLTELQVVGRCIQSYGVNTCTFTVSHSHACDATVVQIAFQSEY